MVRDLNDRLYALLRDLGAPEGVFGCECGDAGCGRSVPVPLHEYALIRAQQSAAVLSPRHSARQPSSGEHDRLQRSDCAR